MSAPQFRGIFSAEEETLPTFKNGVPLFDTVEECLEWSNIESQVGSNPGDPKLKHAISHLFSWDQVCRVLVPRILKSHGQNEGVKGAGPVPPLEFAPPIDLSGNRFAACEPIVKEVSDRVATGFHQRLTVESTLNTLEYLFFHMRCGIFVSIRDGKLVTFCPFVNKDFVNNWGNRLKLEKRNLKEYYKEKVRFYRPENVIPMENWWANGNIICNEHTQPGQETQWWGDNLVVVYKHMLETLCKERQVPDVDFFFNKRDFPQLKKNNTEPYDFVFDQVDTPLDRCKYNAHAPILSFYCSPRYADIPSPTTEDWEGSVGKVFPGSFIPEKKKGKRVKGVAPTMQLKEPRDLYLHENFQKFEVDWEKKANTAFFRGTATGGGTTPENNQRLHIAQLSSEWNRQDSEMHQWDGDPLLDAGITGFNLRDKKLTGSPMTFLRYQRLGFGKSEYVAMYKQGLYKYLLYIQGHCAANRYSFLMRLGSVILKVTSSCEASELWFFPLLEPYKGSRENNLEVVPGGADHVPIKSDLSDLHEKILWCRENDEKCKVIAQNAMQKYEKYVSRDAILDYLQLTMVNIAKSNFKPPKWWTRPTEPVAPIKLEPRVRYCAKDRQKCRRCREDERKLAMQRQQQQQHQQPQFHGGNQWSGSPERGWGGGGGWRRGGRGGHHHGGGHDHQQHFHHRKPY